MPVASLVCGAVALLMAIGGIFTAAMPIVGSIFAFGSPVLALAGVILGGVAYSRTEEMKGLSIAGLVISIVAFVFGLLVAMTCGLCNACVTAGTAGGASAAQSLGNPNNHPLSWLPPVDPNAGSTPAPPPFTGDQRAPIEGETAPPVPVADVLEHLNRSCRDAWCQPENRHYLFTHLSCNGRECAIQFTGYDFDQGSSGPYQGRVRVPRDAIRAGDDGSVVPGPLDAALSAKLEGWRPPTDDFDAIAATTHPELSFVAWANGVCPDGWCEGEISYDYEHVRCQGTECTLFFRWGDYDEEAGTLRWAPGEMQVPRSVIETLGRSDDFDEDAFDRFMALTDAWADDNTG